MVAVNVDFVHHTVMVVVNLEFHFRRNWGGRLGSFGHVPGMFRSRMCSTVGPLGVPDCFFSFLHQVLSPVLSVVGHLLCGMRCSIALPHCRFGRFLRPLGCPLVLLRVCKCVIRRFGLLADITEMMTILCNFSLGHRHQFGVEPVHGVAADLTSH